MRLSRRRLLVSGGAAGIGSAVFGCTTGPTDQGAAPGTTPDASTSAPGAHCSTTFFTPAEAETVEAITARIVPGDAADPGAREAGVVHYIDCLMGVGGFAEPIYMMPPFVAPDDDDGQIELPDGLNWSDVAPLVRTGDPGNELPPGVLEILDDDTIEDLRDDSVESTSFGVLPIPTGQFDRYGWQSFASPAELYRRGLRALDAFTEATFGARFAELSDDDQDQALQALEDDDADGFDLPSAAAFFELIRRHTIEGLFADPIYGGNHDYIGWKLIDYPGAYRGWTPVELRTEGTRRPPQGIEHLPRTTPGEPDGPPRVVAGAGRADGDGDDHGHDHGDGEQEGDEP